MSIAILATGDEIIYGDTLNSNTQALSQMLTSEGLKVRTHMACKDDEGEMKACFEFLSHQHDTIIITGGLGPTTDDKTRFALADFLDIELVVFDKAIEHIEEIVKRASLSMNPGNRQQALFPKGTTLLENPFGTAMGAYFTHKSRCWILLPGPPQECLPMFKNDVLPGLAKKTTAGKSLLKWRVFGMAESQMAQLLEDALKDVPCETGYRLEVPYVEFKVRCEPHLADKITQIIAPLVATHIIAPPEKRASTMLSEKLAHLNDKIIIIDDATGGKLQRSIQRPENSEHVLFHDDPNIAIQFYISGLSEYWQQSTQQTTQITIKYCDETQCGSETHEIPFRSPRVIDYATEWLSFRLFHLIDQLH